MHCLTLYHIQDCYSTFMQKLVHCLSFNYWLQHTFYLIIFLLQFLSHIENYYPDNWLFLFQLCNNKLLHCWLHTAFLLWRCIIFLWDSFRKQNWFKLLSLNKMWSFLAFKTVIYFSIPLHFLKKKKSVYFLAAMLEFLL